MKYFFLFFLLFIYSINAEIKHIHNNTDYPIAGIDYIGGARYPDVVVKFHPKKWAAGFLWEVDGFGTADKVIDRLAKSGKAPIIRIHNVWKDNHNFGRSESEEAIKKCREQAPLIRKYKDIQWYVSPWLEPRGFSISEYEKTIRECRRILPKYVKMVASSLQGTKIIGAVTEMHHRGWKDSVQGRTIFSFDGLETSDADVTKWKKRAKSADIFYFWRWSFNCKFGEKDKRKRQDRTSCASGKDIRSMKWLARKKGKTKVLDNQLYKSHAEQFAPPLSRGNKPVLIFKKRASSVQLRVRGATIYDFNFDKPYSHGQGYLYRGTDWGYEIAKKVQRARKRRKNGRFRRPLANLFINGQKVGRINPAFRDGYFRD